MTDQIAELQNTLAVDLAVLKRSCDESFPKSAELISEFRESLDQIESPEQRQIVAELISFNEAFSNMLLLLAGNLIESFTQLQEQSNSIIRNTIKSHERGQDFMSGQTKPSQN